MQFTPSISLTQGSFAYKPSNYESSVSILSWLSMSLYYGNCFISIPLRYATVLHCIKASAKMEIVQFWRVNLEGEREKTLTSHFNSWTGIFLRLYLFALRSPEWEKMVKLCRKDGKEYFSLVGGTSDKTKDDKKKKIIMTKRNSFSSPLYFAMLSLFF